MEVELCSCAKCPFGAGIPCSISSECQVTKLCKAYVCQPSHCGISCESRLRSCAKRMFASRHTLWYQPRMSSYAAVQSVRLPAATVKVKLRNCAKCSLAAVQSVCLPAPYSVAPAVKVLLRSCAKCSLASTRCEGEVTLWHHAAERRTLLHAAAAAEVWQRPATSPGYGSDWVLIARSWIACLRAGHRFPEGPLRSSGTTVFTASLYLPCTVGLSSSSSSSSLFFFFFFFLRAGWGGRGVCATLGGCLVD